MGMERKTCNHCFGSGTVESWKSTGPQRVSCSICSGSGYFNEYVPDSFNNQSKRGVSKTGGSRSGTKKTNKTLILLVALLWIYIWVSENSENKLINNDNINPAQNVNVAFSNHMKSINRVMGGHTHYTAGPNSVGYALNAYKDIIYDGHTPIVVVDISAKGVMANTNGNSDITPKLIQSQKCIFNLGKNYAKNITFGKRYLTFTDASGADSIKITVPSEALRAIYEKETLNGKTFPAYSYNELDAICDIAKTKI